MVEISGSYIVIQGKGDYLIEAQKQIRDKKVYQEVSDSENKLSKVAEMKKRGDITQNQLRFFSMNIEKPQTLANFISFTKSIKVCIVSQDGQVFPTAVHLQKNIGNFQIVTWKPLMQRGWSYIEIQMIL